MTIRTLLAIAMLASPAPAQLVELGGGMTMPTGDVDLTRDAGFAGYASGWWRFTDNLLAGASVEYARLSFDRFTEAEIVAAEGFDLGILSMMLQTRLVVPMFSGLFEPSLILGTGVTRHKAAIGRVRLDDGRTFSLDPDPDWGIVGAGGIGLYVSLVPAIGIQTDVRYLITASLENDPKRWQVDAGVRVRVR